MRFNDREIVKLGENKADLEGILHHMKPQGKDWTDWYQQPSFKERYFKLTSNILFYYRVNENEPLGILVLENAQVAYERPHKGIPFAFSLTFKVNDRFRDNEAKHIFSCRCDEDVNKWVSALKVASYEYWRSQYAILKAKISIKTGEDPFLNYMKSKTETSKVEIRKTKVKEVKKASFYSHVSSFHQSSTYSSSQIVTKTDNITTVDNLIDL